MPIELARVRNALAERRHKEASVGADVRFAAVAAVLREHAGATEVLLIRRTEQSGDPWSGHMAFPGGRHDPSDENLLATAIRETREETGLILEPGQHLAGRLDDLPAIAGGRHLPLVIAPFVFTLSFDPQFSRNDEEVAEILWAPVEPMLRGDAAATHEYSFGAGKISLPAFRVRERIVWGLTHRMLIGLFDALDGGDRAAALPY